MGSFTRFRLMSEDSEMAYKITDACVACGACTGTCPVEAIKEGDVYSIDADGCIDCGSCVDSCPSGAIMEG